MGRTAAIGSLLRRTCLLAVIAVAPLATGCAGREALKAGDRAWLAGDAVAAARHYEMAVAQRPNLAKNTDFAQRLREARRESAYRQGVDLIQRRDWDAAIERLEDALSFEPGYRLAEEALTRAHAGAADAAYQRALAAADAGKLPTVRAELKTARTHVPDHAAARAALASLDDPRAVTADGGAAADLMQQRRWPQAIAALDTAITDHTDHAAARLLRAEARASVQRTAELLQRGRGEFAAKELDRALATLGEAARVSPHDEAVSAALGRAKAAWAEVNRLQDAAAAAITARRWDDAISRAQQARAIYPGAARAADLEAQARTAAADELTARGEQARSESKLADAEAAFRRALGYQPDHPAARRGLAAVALVRADAAADASRWGEAFLWALDADEFDPADEARDRVNAAEAHVLDRAAPAIEARAAGSGSTDAVLFEDAFIAALRRRASDRLHVVTEPAAAQPRYAVTVSGADFDASEERVATRSLTHPFEVRREVHNPRRGPIVWELRRIEDKLEDLDRERFAAYNAYLAAKRRADRNPENPALKERADRLAARHEEVEERKEHTLDRRDELRSRLHREPEIIIEAIPARWDYTVSTYRKSAELSARVAATDRQTGRELPPITVRESAAEQDDAIDRPNPEIGLRDDPLVLPSDASMRDALVRSAADKAAAGVASRVLDAAIATARSAAGAATDPAQAREHRIDAAFLAQDRADLTRLREELRHAAR